jgi:hypothetical protein
LTENPQFPVIGPRVSATASTGLFFRNSLLRVGALATVALLIWQVLWPTLKAVAVYWWETLWPPYDLSWYDPLLWAVLTIIGIYFGLALLGDLIFLAKVPVQGLGRLLSRNPEWRHIVLCIDGTWNAPSQGETDAPPDTNVVKFWAELQPVSPMGPIDRLGAWFVGYADHVVHQDVNEEQVHRDVHESDEEDGLEEEGDVASEEPDGDAGVSAPPGCAHRPKRQIALYYAGLGNRKENSTLGVMLGGAFGFGARLLTARIMQDVIRWYTPGSLITIVGFSRGAAVARLVAGEIGRAGVPRGGIFGLTLLYPFRRFLPRCLREKTKVNFLGLWDTVASFGLAKNMLGIPFQQINVGMNLDVRDSAERIVHLISIDDERDSFHPTVLGLKAEDVAQAECRCTEVWVTGVHSDVGGGRDDTRLSDVYLEYMILRALETTKRNPDSYWIQFARYGPQAIDFADVRDRWCHGVGEGTLGTHDENSVFSRIPRAMPIPVRIHWTVFERLKRHGAAYSPAALLDLVERTESRDALGKRVGLGSHCGTTAQPTGDAWVVDRFGLP